MKGVIKPFRYMENNSTVVGQRRITMIGDAGRRYEKVKPFVKVKG